MKGISAALNCRWICDAKKDLICISLAMQLQSFWQYGNARLAWKMSFRNWGGGKDGVWGHALYSTGNHVTWNQMSPHIQSVKTQFKLSSLIPREWVYYMIQNSISCFISDACSLWRTMNISSMYIDLFIWEFVASVFNVLLCISQWSIFLQIIYVPSLEA